MVQILGLKYVNDEQNIYIQGSSTIPGTGRARLPIGQGRLKNQILINTTLNIPPWSKWVKR